VLEKNETRSSGHVLELVDNELVLEARVVLQDSKKVALCDLLALGSGDEIVHGLLGTLAAQHYHVNVLGARRFDQLVCTSFH